MNRQRQLGENQRNPFARDGRDTFPPTLWIDQLALQEWTMSQETNSRVTFDRLQLQERVATLPREPVAALPTPLEEAPRLRDHLGPNAPRIFIKRDDLTGLALGGNKVRHLEFRLGDMKRMGADSLVVTNVAQSNHARLHTALAAKHGLTSYIIKIPSPKDSPVNGNLLLDHIMGANIIEAPDAETETIDRELEALVSRLESEGHIVYNVPRNTFSKMAGTCAYLLAAIELLEQLEAFNTKPDHIFLASGTSSAGLALAGKLLGESYQVHPVSVSGKKADVGDKLFNAANNAAELLLLDVRLDESDVEILDEYVGERYGVPTEAGLEALKLAGRTEGLILEPVYTSKAMSALIDFVRKGRIGRDETVVFVHTGGLPITFAYAEEILTGLQIPH
jgi:1-aminocyclopropane-1-carboxylate deaminase/D-cysteine desulfhydrase-like pyridoxal-dependent ACC family enzyme